MYTKKLEKKITLKKFSIYIVFDNIKRKAADVAVKCALISTIARNFFLFSFQQKSIPNMNLYLKIYNHQNSTLRLLLIMIIIIIVPRYNSGITSRRVSLLYEVEEINKGKRIYHRI